jgi:RimJ/RimL family protein N-acetyltransferase
VIERTFDAAFFNHICNLPEVRPKIGGQGEIDTTSLISNPSNYALRSKYGGFILITHGAGFYSVHTQFAAEGRGQHAIAAMQAGLEWMFTRTDCMRIFSHCPDDNPAAFALARKGGAKDWFYRRNHELGPGQTVSWEILDWATSEPSLEEHGRAFHNKIEEAKAKAGSERETHADDAVHDRVVGAALLMAQRGNVKKGVGLYSLWAAAAGYAPIRLISEAPPLVDVGDGIVGLTNEGELEVLACR